MDQAMQSRFIPQQLLYFIAGRRCCQQFSCTFRTSDHNILIGCARSLGLRSQYILMTSSQGCVKVFKQSCKHYLEEPKTLSLSHSTVMDMFTLLARAVFVEKDELFIHHTENFSQPWINKLPPSLHMPVVSLRPPKPRHKSEQYRQYLMKISSSSYYKDILKIIYSHRVIVFEAGLHIDAPLLFPITLIEDCESKKSNLKLICIEREDIVAFYNSERLAKCLKETVGETVGIQVPQHSTISSATHVVYTTAKYFLRTLFNKRARKLDQISHFVVNDIHLNDPYTDILLYELKQALNANQNIRLLLVSQTHDTRRFINFFGEGSEFCMEQLNLIGYRFSYLEDIQSSIALAGIQKGPRIYREKPSLFRNKTIRNEQMDKCLMAYAELGSDAAICPFLYSINYDLVPVNYQHSLTGKTAILIASQLCNANHLRLLLYLGANPYIADEQNENAVTVAAFQGNTECIDILNNYSIHGYVVKNAKPEFVDYDVIIGIMILLCTKPEYSPGNILIILPTFYHVIKLNYMLLSQFLTGNLRTFSIHLLHSNMDKEYLDSLVNSKVETLKVVLATDIIESLVLPISFKYLIDTACRKKTVYDGSSASTEDIYEWVSKDCLVLRQLLLLGEASSDWHCFRLISKETFQMLSDKCRPTMQTMKLDQICLTVKLLSPNTIISEYLSYVISPPPLIHIHQTVQFLKKIDVLDDSEDVTWLGCRLVDLPLSCQLGRTLIFGILLQCLDPILTIVSSLSTPDPLSLPFSEDIDCLWDRFTIYIQNRIKRERLRLAEDQFSDHFIFLRLFQEWQNQVNDNITPYYLTDEHDFLINGLMEQLNITRVQIVGSLRAANLVHSQGPLSIQSVNFKCGNWALVKAALTGGMYPNIFAVDPKKNTLKSSHATNVHLHPNTVLRGFLEPFNLSAQNICTQWIVSSRQKNHIKYATVVVPLAVALFAGATTLGCKPVTECQSMSPNNTNIHFFIDEWIWMVVSKSDFELLIKTRQNFFNIYQYFLKYCNDMDKWRSDSVTAIQHIFLLETLAIIFKNEDTAAGFIDAPPIGLRSTLKLPNLYLLNINAHFTLNPKSEEKIVTLNTYFVERHFFLLYTEENAGNFYKKSDALYIERVIGKFARPIDSPGRHIYVILYSKNPDLVISISRVKIQKNVLVLKEYFRNTIPVCEILEASASINVKVPSFDGRLLSSLIDKRIGNLIMDMFAFRHHWIHNQ